MQTTESDAKKVSNSNADVQYVIGVDEAGRGCMAGPVSVGAVCLRLNSSSSLGFTVDDSKAMTEVDRETVFAAVLRQLDTTPEAVAHEGGRWWRVKSPRPQDGAPLLGACNVLVSHDVIDTINILNATLEGMALAIDLLIDKLRGAGFPLTPQNTTILVDGNRRPWAFLPADQRSAILKKAEKKGDYSRVGKEYPSIASFPLITVVGGDSSLASVAVASVVAKVCRDTFLVVVMDAAYPQYLFREHKGYCTAGHKRLLLQYGLSPFHRKSYAPVKECLKRKREEKPMMES